jgi:hypothetical protein
MILGKEKFREEKNNNLKVIIKLYIQKQIIYSIKIIRINKNIRD